MGYTVPYTILLTGIDAGKSAIRNHLLRNADLELIEVAASDIPPRGRPDDSNQYPDVVVVGPGLPQPLAAACHLRRRSPRSQVVFLVSTDRMERFRASLPFVPQLSDAWTAAAEDPGDIVGAVILEAAGAARRREAVISVFDRINMQISSQAAMGEAERRQHQILLSERFMAVVLMQAPDPIFALNPEGEIISSNDAAFRLFAGHPNRTVGQSALLLFPESGRLEMEGLFVRARRGEIIHRYEVLIATGEQAVRFAAISLAPIREDQIVGYVLTIRDVTELRDAQLKLRVARRELAEVTRRTTLAAMSAAIAHEIKQPLAAIVTNANAGLRWLTATPPRLDQACDTFRDIAADGLRAGEVIQSVRAMFSRRDHGGTVFDVNELIRETIALAGGELEAARIAVELELASELPLIYAHRVQLQQVVLNVVTNAADAMRTIADRERVLRIKSKPFEQNGVELTVKDFGTGIEPQNVDRIFDAFFTTKVNGMGMGLAICRSIVEAHGGTLSVSPGTPHGSVFRLVLPSNR